MGQAGDNGPQSDRHRPHPPEPWSATWTNLAFRLVEGYSPASAARARGIITPPEICDAIRKAATTAGTHINLRN
jgi:hypothetical protein